jgi:hypothetical protein
LAIGSRYLSITPAGGGNPVALLLTGDGGDADVGCVSLYVQSDGALGESVVRRTPTEWGTVYVTGTRIRPDTTYRVQTVCVLGPGPDIRSTAVIVRTWPWGDVNNNGATDIEDIVLVINASDVIPDGAILENFDVSPCLPDGVIDEADRAAVQAAMTGNPFPCAAPCPAGPNLEMYADFEACLGGPAVEVIGGCESFDGDESGAVDLDDFADFQRAFVGP